MNIQKKHSGIICPTITPITATYRLDETAAEQLFDSLYEHEIDPFILGTTGESASLPFALKKAFIKKAGSIKRPGTKLYTGISATVLSESIELAHYSFEHGADAVAATLPSYYQLSEKQMEQYFIQLADAVNAPLIVYNIPATTHMSIPVPVIDRLSQHPHIVGVKDSERSDERLQQSISLWKERDDFSYLLGWAARSDKALLTGADGLIPSTGNFAPGIYATMWKAARLNDIETVNRMQVLSDVYGNIYQKNKTLGESLWALKVLLQQKGIGQPVLMPPLDHMDELEKQKIIEEWRSTQVTSQE